MIQGGDERLQARHADFTLRLEGVEAVLAKCLNDIPDVHQVNCGAGFLLKQGTSGGRYPRSLTICRLLNVSQFGGCSVGGESDEVERLKTQILQNRYPWLQIHLLLLVC